MKAFVTGASGFVGSCLVEQLAAEGVEVHALMRKTSKLHNLKDVPYTPVEGSLSDFESLRRAVRGVDVVFHLAGVVAAPNRESYFECNAEGTRKLAAAVAEENPGLRRFVYVSSLAAGGPTTSLVPRDEQQTDAPASDYGKSKLQGEQEVLRYRDKYPVAIVRPPMVYGPRDRGVYVIAKNVARNLMPLPPSTSPDGHKYYSAVHVSDLCRGILLAGRSSVASGESFYVSGDGVHSYEALIRAMADGLGKKPIRFRVPRFALIGAAHALDALSRVTGTQYPLNVDKLNEILPDYWICSNEKAKSVLGFAPQYGLADGIRHTMEWYKKEGWL